MSHEMDPVTRRMFMALGGMAAAGTLGAAPAFAQGRTMTPQDKKNVDLVMAMSAAWKTRDVQKVAAYMHEDVWFRGGADKVEAPGTKGKKAFIDSIAKFLSATSIDMVVTDAFALHPMVITCHHQLFENKERGLHEDLYIGCFYIQDGLIREWNDYAIIPYAQPRAKDTAARAKFFQVPV